VTLTTGYAYDAAGRLTAITYPSGRVVNLTYTSGQMTGLALGGVDPHLRHPLSALRSPRWLDLGGRDILQPHL
jgi:YD repeat-containing protein